MIVPKHRRATMCQNKDIGGNGSAKVPREKPPFRGGFCPCHYFWHIPPTPFTPFLAHFGTNWHDRLKGAKTMPRKSKPKKPPITIIEDTREQTPLTDWPATVAVENGTLHTGDYSIKGWENCFTVERKSLEDFAGTMMGGYEANSEKPKKRFNRELERMRHFDCASVVGFCPVDLYDLRRPRLFYRQRDERRPVDRRPCPALCRRADEKTLHQGRPIRRHCRGLGF